MAQMAVAQQYRPRAEKWPDSIFAFAWRDSGRHQPWLCLLAVLIFPLTMVPLELQRRIIDRAIGDQKLELLLWLGAIYLGAVLLQGGLKYLLRVYGAFVGERATLKLRGAVHKGMPTTSRARRSRSSPPRWNGSAASSAKPSPNPSCRVAFSLPCWATCWWWSRPSP